MHTLEFLSILVEDIYVFFFINIIMFMILHFATISKLSGGVLNPLYIILVVGFSTKYAIVSFLYINGHIVTEYMVLSFVYLLLLLVSYQMSLRLSRGNLLFKYCKCIISPYGSYFYKAMLTIYIVLAIFTVYKIGFGIFAETNRFENSRGFGAFIRIMDAVSMYIIVYSAISTANSNDRVGRKLKLFLLIIFIIFAAFLNGAKISILFSLMGVYIGLLIHGIVPKIRFGKKIKIVSLGLIFILLALSINLKQNNISSDNVSKLIPGAPLLLDRFVNRIISNGNTAYLLLPNEVIEQIDTDSVIVRFFTPVIGITQMSRLIGYNAGDYSVGRQALLYYDRFNKTAGGPTSHFDYFSYVYLGVIPGALFVILIGIILGVVSREIYNYRRNKKKSINVSAFFVAFWFRLVITLVEPTVGLAYVLDVVVIFLLVSVFLNVLKRI
ncbi:TPA: hypothetical protein ACGU4U_001495 [Vibrio vulnificus]|nr:hypothetical protein [Vibrio vulnificus]ELC9717436.1 hypothetical protein [Vibrio vulnificus]ELS0762142.1 hypothetical protein [Vibrio vulnificus]